MLNILLTGIGGQGTVLAAKVLAQAARNKGWQVRTAETIGMAQRGGSVISHVRMGDEGETVHEPLLAMRSADLIVAFEPGEAVRVLPYLKSTGLLVTASSIVPPVSAALSNSDYQAEELLAYLKQVSQNLVIVDDVSLCESVGSTKVLNTVLLAKALSARNIGIDIEDLKQAIRESVKEHFIELNVAAIDASAPCATGTVPNAHFSTTAS